MPTSDEKPALKLGGREAFWMGGRIISVKISTAQTGERCCVTESVMAPGHGPPLYRFLREDQLYVILNGQFSFRVDGVDSEAGPGDVLFAPRGVLHTYRVNAGDPARYLMISTPGYCWENYLKAISKPALKNTLPDDDFEPLPMEIIHRIALGAGLELVGPRLEGANRTGLGGTE